MPNNAIISLECFNGPNGSHPVKLFEHIQVDANGIGQASSFKVQFNINVPPVGDTIYVDENNNGMAIARIQGDYLFIENSARVEFDPNGYYTYDHKDFNKIGEIITVKRPIDFTNKQIIFAISQNQRSKLKGSITVTFTVKFKAGN